MNFDLFFYIYTRVCYNMLKDLKQRYNMLKQHGAWHVSKSTHFVELFTVFLTTKAIFVMTLYTLSFSLWLTYSKRLKNLMF